MGYSHWCDPDHEEFTIECLANVILGKWNIAFFNAIAGYFEMSVSDFYNHVVMFEFVPCAIGGGDDRYNWATPEQSEVGGRRMLRIAEENALDKLLVFSTKGWNSAPETIEDREKRKVYLGDTRFEVGHYSIGNRLIPAVGLRHPQYARKAEMRKVVEAALAFPVGVAC